MAHVSRRYFLLSSAALATGCAVRGRGDTAATDNAAVRSPAVGQSWRYAKRDIYTNALIDDQVDQIAAIGQTIDIDSRSEAAAAPSTGSPAWGTAWLRKYVPHRERPDGPLPSEIQAPWGKVLVDPHWSHVQVYETPIPLWPTQLAPGWRVRINTRYKTPNNEYGLPWDQTMAAHEWGTITVPAGRFRALRFTNMVSFRSPDFSRANSQRKETLWFAPEVGRWVVRESTGSYYIDDSSVDTPYEESGYRWELLEWS
jgi:hypothetical protein